MRPETFEDLLAIGMFVALLVGLVWVIVSYPAIIQYVVDKAVFGILLAARMCT